jgi:purine-binding chemotaxis protein CheW
MSDTAQYATFSLAGYLFGVEVLKVQEVLRHQEMTRVPLASGTIEGLINLRGQIVTAIDMRRRLGLPERPVGMKPMSVVVRAHDAAVSFQVDQIGDVLELDTAALVPAPDHISGCARELIGGIYQLDERLLLVLNTERAVEVE